MAAVVRIAEQSRPHDVCVYLWLPGALDSIIALPKENSSMVFIVCFEVASHESFF